MGARVDELTSEAEKVKDGLIALMLEPAGPVAPSRAVEGAFGDAAVSIGDALQDISERLRRLGEIIADLQAASAAEEIPSGY
ncbi:MAG TPA: hypothetical protein VH475_21670 [Tepidisphaeraceae bacterium]